MESRDEKSRSPVVETEERHTERDARLAQSIPLPDDNTRGRAAQGIIEKLLPKGETNALKMMELRQIMGMSDTRVIRQMIADERAAGAVILSSENGYFRPSDGELGRIEARKFVASMTHRGANTIRATKSAQRFLDNLPGQTEIGGGVSD